MANAVQGFIDSEVGLVVATTLHTAGAILYLGGLAAYLVWHRHLVKGQHQVKVLAGASALTYVAILANLLGGFMRTYEAGHPHLTAIAESPWVRVMVAKHLVLFAGMGAAVYLFERVAPRLIREHAAGTLRDPYPSGHRTASFLVGFSILLAAALGALSQVTPLRSDDGGDGAEHAGDHAHAATYDNSTGQLTSTPLSPASGTGDVEVPANTSLLEATLVWSPEQFELGLALEDPAGGAFAGARAAPGRVELSVEAPLAGRWVATVSSTLAVNAQWTLTVRMTPGLEGETFLAETVVVPPGTFFEINTEMPLGASLAWDWRTDGAAIAFDVHSHFDGDVQVWAEASGTQDAGSYTNGRAGGYSYLWENAGAAPVRLSYRAWGGFTVDSYFPPRP